jgi:hypothetical protein
MFFRVPTRERKRKVPWRTSHDQEREGPSTFVTVWKRWGKGDLYVIQNGWQLKRVRGGDTFLCWSVTNERVREKWSSSFFMVTFIIAWRNFTYSSFPPKFAKLLTLQCINLYQISDLLSAQINSNNNESIALGHVRRIPTSTGKCLI